ncbi:redox-sensitive transcriptional activator SoxR, partial [Vibrio sp. B4-12]
MSNDWTVGKVAQRSGVSISTLHFYERQGLIKSDRNAGNQRRYRKDILRRVSVIKAAQKLGISLAEIQQALETLPDSRTPTQKDWQALSAQWK